MTTQYTSILKLALPVQGELSGTWGDVVNDNITSMVEQAIAGRAVIDSWTANAHTLTTANGVTSESRCAMLEFTDSGTQLTGAGSVVCPTLSKIYIAKNASGQNVTLKTSGGTGILVPNGRTMFLFCDGTNVVEAVTSTTSLQLGTSTTVTAVLDEDNMASNSAVSLATQQSIKAYVDAQVATSDTLAEVLANGNTTGGTDVSVSTDDKVQFRDAAIYINSSADGQLDIVADTEIQIAATTVDVNGILDVSGNIVAGGTVDGRDIATDGTKLDGIEASADVTDTTNVTAAGALMDSEVTNLAQVKAFDSADYATAAQGTTADAALPTTGGAMTGAITTNSTFDGRDVATDGTKLDGIEASADVTDTTNVTAAGALMDSEVDADIKTLSVPANTTISDYGKTLVDDADAAAARTTLGLGTAATTAATDYATAAQGTTADAALPKAGGAMTGAITTNSTFDGRDVATDGTKLDGIEASADVTDTTNVVASLTAGSNITIAADGTIASTASGGEETLQETLGFGNTTTTDTKIQFRDSGLYINSSADGQLDIVADTEVQIAATTVDVNGILDVSGNIVAGGTVDGVDIAARDGVLTTTTTTANAALPKAGGAMTGAITTNSTFDGRDVATDGTKLDGIEASADVTDATNVTAAGALMDSELTSEASVKALDQGVATTDSPAFAGLTVDTTTLAVDSTNNRVGIGTASPSAPLHVQKGSAGSSAFPSGDWAAKIFNQTDASTEHGLVVANRWQNDASTAFEVGGLLDNGDGFDTWMKVAGDGKVGIGTTAPEYNLDVTAADNVTTTTAISVQNSARNYGLGLGAYTLTNRNIGGTATTVDYTFDIGGDAIFKTSNAERMRILDDGKVGIGTASPLYTLDVAGTFQVTLPNSTSTATITTPTSLSGFNAFKISNSHTTGSLAMGTAVGSATIHAYGVNGGGIPLAIKAGAGNGTALNFATTGITTLGSSGHSQLVLNKTGTQNTFKYISAATYLSGVQSRHYYGTSMLSSSTSDNTVYGVALPSTSSTGRFYPAQSGTNGLFRDNSIDCGHPSSRWDDVYATNGTIQTSDEREKQDIEELTDVEQRVAVRAKGLLRKFRWKDSVESKGDDARIHFGIIAQDLEAAFVDEGLDSSDYAMFIKTEWWIGAKTWPAVPEELDEEGNVISEGKDSHVEEEHYYEDEADAPSDATHHYRMGVRYSELLAFIIAAL